MSLRNFGLKYKIEAMVDTLAKETTANPSSAGDAVNQIAERVTSPIAVEVLSSQSKAAVHQVDLLLSELNKIDAVTTELKGEARMLEQGKYDRLLAQMTSSSGAERTQAVEDIIRDNKRLSDDQLKRLVEMMRTGNQEWVTNSYRPPGHHCTDYEYTSIRYYAAWALREVDSTRINSSIKQEAAAAESNGRSTRRV
ncbi:MAG: hypothetical protein EHM67_12825, partial [Hyphomicrobiaceae bacterium]